MNLRSRLDRLRRSLLLRRRLLAALAGAVCVYAAVMALSPPPAQTRTVWAANEPVAPGEVLSRDHLRAVEYLPEMVPQDAVSDPRDVVGRAVSRALSPGDPLGSADVLDQPWLEDQGGDSVVPVRISDAAVVSLLRAGDTVDILATDPSASGGDQPAVSLARGARVVAVPKKADNSDSTAVPGRLVLFGVPAAQVPALTRASAGYFLTVAWIR